MSPSAPSSQFCDQVAIVTGGSSGIGKQLAQDLLAAGALVTITGHDAGRIEEARREIAASFPKVEASVCDVRHMSQIGDLVRGVVMRRGRVDVLINNAGYAVYR